MKTRVLDTTNTARIRFGRKIRSLRMASGLSQQALADKLGVHRITVVVWENGRWLPRRSSLHRLSSALDADLSGLYSRACVA